MQMARSAQQLNYFQQAPVRGQLEPPEAHHRTGWRYLQCTDTPNELRVLIPPRTALVYSYLLRAEVLELARGETAAWDRLIQIRHLKDRMIRKCQRLARASTSKDKNTGQTMLFTCHAPPDFKLKEMERWFRDQGPEFVKRVSASTRGTQVLHGRENAKATKTPIPYCCTKCGPLGAAGQPSRKAADPATRTATTSPKTTPATRSATVSRSNSTTRTPTPTREAPPPRRPRPRTPVEIPERPARSVRPPRSTPMVPERVPKQPSGSSTETFVEPEALKLDVMPKIEIIEATPIEGPENKQLTPPASRSSSRSTYRSSRKSIPTEHIPPMPSIPAVIRQPDTPRSLTPQESVKDSRPPSRTPSRARSRSRSRSPHFGSQVGGGSQVGSISGSLTGSLLDVPPPRSAMASPDPLPIPFRSASLFPPRASISSPDPLPIPFRPRNESINDSREECVDDSRKEPIDDFEADSDSDDSDDSGSDVDFDFDSPPVSSLGSGRDDDLQHDDVHGQAPSEDGTLVGQQNDRDENDGNEPPTTGQPLETIHEGSEAAELPVGRPLIRRRSSLKKRDSMSRMSAGSASKSVTWAMDRDWTDQMSKFIKSSNEADVAAYELEELRHHYHEEITMMKIVCRDAVVAAEAAGLDVDALKRQEVALAEQENKVVAITDHMESKEEFFKQKVLTVLDETRKVVQLCDKKRDQRDT